MRPQHFPRRTPACRRIGSPPHAIRLASSEPLTGNWPLVVEDVLFNHAGLGGDADPRARCDMVYFTTPGGGAVFAASSIAWSGALPVNDFDNDISRIMRNVIDRFAERE